MFYFNYKKRCYIVLSLFIIAFLFLIRQLVYYQYLRKSYLNVLTNSQYTYKENISDMNYILLDRNGKDLLCYKYNYYAVIDPRIFLKNNGDTDADDLTALNLILKSFSSNYDISIINFNNLNKKMYYAIDEEAYRKILILKNIKGFYVYKKAAIDRSKTYSIENILTNRFKSDGSSIKSETCLESEIASKTRSNSYSRINFNIDVNGSISEGKVNTPENNINVKLTIDKDIQDSIEGVLKKYNKSNNIGVVLMEASTGKILGLVNRDNSNPNLILGGIGEGFEPASTFKVIVEEAALENKKAAITDKFQCSSIYEKSKEYHGFIDMEKALTVSCNDIFAAIGKKTGFSEVLTIAENQGILNYTKVLDIDCEKKGDKVSLKTDEYPSFYFGQTKRITPIQAISIPNTVINGGIYVKPEIIDSYVSYKNSSDKETEKHTVISKSTADTVRNNMIDVVKLPEGTGHNAYIEGLETGGKTGTSERNTNHSDGWFSGFFNINNKYYSMVVLVNDINPDTESAGTTAAPVFKNIVLEVKKYLN